MHELRRRSAPHRVVPIAVVIGAGLAAPAEAEEPMATASMQCERATEPGRVRCAVELRAASGRSISWADVALLELPDFAAALKGRIGPADVVASEPTAQKWAFGLIARRAGRGVAKARVRAVVCEVTGIDAAAPRCMPTTVEVTTTVDVG